jgi:hypothetical protein
MDDQKAPDDLQDEPRRIVSFRAAAVLFVLLGLALLLMYAISPGRR